MGAVGQTGSRCCDSSKQEAAALDEHQRKWREVVGCRLNFQGGTKKISWSSEQWCLRERGRVQDDIQVYPDLLRGESGQ